MPSVAEEPPFHDGTRANAQHSLSLPCKKRRWEDGRSRGDDAVVSLILHDENELLSHRTSPIRSSMPQRKIIPLSSSKRPRLGSCDGSNNVDGCRSKSAKDSSASASTHASSSSSSSSSALMLPCHVCQRKPRRKSDLDSQADCEGCGQRACFVCLRECPGWAANGFRDDGGAQTPTDEAGEHGLCHFGMAPQPQPQSQSHQHQHQIYRKLASRPWSASSRGHRRIICSRCCVERGQDGEVVCLGCMAS